MADTKNVVFRTAIKGYNKSDVNEYLVRMSEESTAREDAARERALRAEKEAREYELEIEDLKSDSEKLRTELSETVEELNKARAEINELESRPIEIDTEGIALRDQKIGEQEAIIAKQFEEIDSLREQLAKANELQKEADDENARYEELMRKAQLYDKTSANIGDAIISAKKTAEEIVAAAKEEARILTDRAQKELEDKRKAIEESSQRAFESIFSKLLAAASENRKEVAGASAYAAQVFEKAISEIKARNESANTKLKNYEDSLWKSIRDDLDSISTQKQAKKPLNEQIKRIKK